MFKYFKIKNSKNYFPFSVVLRRMKKITKLKIKNFLNAPDNLLAGFFIKLIIIYQRTVSPDHSDLGKTQQLHGCKFYPSCSQYAVEVLKTKGFMFGIPKILGRTFRCHPWSKGGVDFPK